MTEEYRLCLNNYSGIYNDVTMNQLLHYYEWQNVECCSCCSIYTTVDVTSVGGALFLLSCDDKNGALSIDLSQSLEARGCVD